MKIKESPELVKIFEDNFVKGTCFDTIQQAINDKTPIQINAPRALIAVELTGRWYGFIAGYREGLKEMFKREEGFQCLMCGKYLGPDWTEEKRYHMHFCLSCRKKIMHQLLVKENP